MINTNKIFTILPNKTKIEYDVVLTFKSEINNKNYVIYTDNNYDSNKKLRIFAGIYNPNDNIYLGEPTTKEEWNEIILTLDNTLLQQ